MSDFLRLAWKEARELFRPRYLLPILAVPIFFVALGYGIGGATDAIGAEPEVGIVDNDDGALGDVVVDTFEEGADVVYHEERVEDSDAALSATREAGGSTLLVIPSDFSERIEAGERGGIEQYTAVESVSLTGIASSTQVGSLLDGTAGAITMEVTGATPEMLDPIATSHTTIVRGERVDQPPGALSSAFSTQFIFIPVVIMLVILVSGQMVMNSMGIEKENKTLETLMTMPVKRRTIVTAKLAGSASVGLLAAAAYTVGIYYYQGAFETGDGSFGPFQLGLADYALVGISLFVALIGVLALALCLGVFAGDRQGAQMLLYPISVLAFLPMMATIFADITTLSLPLQAGLFAIPFTHPIVAPKQLLFGNPGIVLAGIAYTTLFAVAAIGLAIYLFDSDRLITGEAGRFGKVFSFVQR